jgi:hypothetical protein
VIEHAGVRWTDNLDQLGWSAGGLVLVLAAIILVVGWARG